MANTPKVEMSRLKKALHIVIGVMLWVSVIGQIPYTYSSFFHSNFAEGFGTIILMILYAYAGIFFIQSVRK